VFFYQEALFLFFLSTFSKEVSTNCKIIELFRSEKTLKIIKSNRKPSTAKSTTKPCP